MRRLALAAGLILATLSPSFACQDYAEVLKRAHYARDTSKPEDAARVIIMDGDVLTRLLAVINTLHGASLVADRAIVLQWSDGAFLSLATGECVTGIYQFPASAWRNLMDLVLGKDA